MSDASPSGRTHKVIAAVRGRVDDTVPEVDGLVACSVHRPHPDEPAQHPPDVDAVVMAWFDPATVTDPATLRPDSWFDAPVEAYLVDERVQIDWTRDWADGEPTPAIEQLPFVRRLPGLTREQFAAHWSERHAPLVPTHHPGVARYVQNVVIRPLTAGAPEFDGVAQLYFRTAHDLHERYYDSEAGRQVVGDDVARFLDRGNGWRMIARETWLRS